MNRFKKLQDELLAEPKNWLVTGCAGFIGSNLVEALLKLKQNVVGLDNFSTGFQKNLDEIKKEVSESEWRHFKFIEGNITDAKTCLSATENVNYVLHQAALGSVPRSINDPVNTNDSNVTGFINMLWASKENKIDRFVFASSSSVYGDDLSLPKKEDIVGNVLSPYAATKKINEIYAEVFGRTYDIKTIGLRYFNVFGKRQDPNGAYAAVIPLWVKAMLTGEEIYINGDGETSRDFCYIKNVIQMNLLAATEKNDQACNRVYNCAFADRTSLNDLFKLIQRLLTEKKNKAFDITPSYREFRSGDIRHSHANITNAKEFLGYDPAFSITDGMIETLDWYINNI